ARAAFGRELLAVLARLVEVAAVDDDLGAEVAHRLHLDRVRFLGHADRGGDAEQLRGVSDRLPVVTGRGARDSRAPLGRGELREEVDAAADLERARRLVVLVLDEERGADQAVERGVAAKLRRREVGPDPRPRLEDVDERRRAQGRSHGQVALNSAVAASSTAPSRSSATEYSSLARSRLTNPLRTSRSTAAGSRCRAGPTAPPPGRRTSTCSPASAWTSECIGIGSRRPSARRTNLRCTRSSR